MVELIKRRRSCRKYLDRNIPEKIIEQLILSAVHAPGGWLSKPGSQGFRAIIIRDDSVKGKLALHYGDRQFIKTAPVIIACLSDKTTDPKYNEWDISCALSIQNLLLAAESNNLGACFITCFLNSNDNTHKEQKQILRKVLGLPENIELVALITLGYKDSSEIIEEKLLLDYDEVVSHEMFGKHK
ncbi:MAG: nitroreductase family protein [Firmicutes bacterium]|nr:nitroreductase family protein [Bacillota bacterium]